MFVCPSVCVSTPFFFLLTVNFLSIKVVYPSNLLLFIYVHFWTATDLILTVSWNYILSSNIVFFYQINLVLVISVNIVINALFTWWCLILIDLIWPIEWPTSSHDRFSVDSWNEFQTVCNNDRISATNFWKDYRSLGETEITHNWHNFLAKITCSITSKLQGLGTDPV